MVNKIKQAIKARAYHHLDWVWMRTQKKFIYYQEIKINVLSGLIAVIADIGLYICQVCYCFWEDLETVSVPSVGPWAGNFKMYVLYLSGMMEVNMGSKSVAIKRNLTTYKTDLWNALHIVLFGPGQNIKQTIKSAPASSL
jgi:hypothetical protein